MHDVVRRLEDGSLRANISQTIPFNMAIGVLNSLDRYSCGKTVVVMDTDFQPQPSLWTVSSDTIDWHNLDALLAKQIDRKVIPPTIDEMDQRKMADCLSY